MSESNEAILDSIKNYKSRYTRPNRRRHATEEERKARNDTASAGVEAYYPFITRAFMQGWSEHFHYAPFAPHEPIEQALAFYEHKLANIMGLKPGMKVLDVGCGIGGPAREIAKFIGCEIVGISINQNHIDEAIEMTAQAGLSHLCTFVRGDFMNMPFAPSSFDAAYALEATCHAPSLQKIYKSIARVLKPNAPFGLSEWVMTDTFDATNDRHIAIRDRIEYGCGVSNMDTVSNARAALQSANFDLIFDEDYAQYWNDHLRFFPSATSTSADLVPFNMTPTSHSQPKSKPKAVQQSTSPSPVLVPFQTGPSKAPPPSLPIVLEPRIDPSAHPRQWIYPLLGQTSLTVNSTDYWTTWRMSTISRKASYWLIYVLEKLRIYPKGIVDTMDVVRECVDSCAEGGMTGVFSPCWWFVGIKKAGVGDVLEV